ncbi:hypothetical protein EJV82_15360 [Salmonella enterica subsp. enterica serovar Blockley]|nr:hypothetical protein [Salmonella enterica subsp. enterica serovar Blockley]EBU9058338.1 hypothetical protein [Salmonella enterica subsp. enterica serovar Blockley]EBW4932942.1 hypothetical protein [Salmonella enterica subsp. enterica serovar Blockley]EBX5450483.1 hypothetical protein [Salmonella enterica subsp. enterica serovar Blockley]EBY8449059.1 hypothetical protein [Salmonella enterica subsp. enterica serovar Blockley]
MNILLRGKIESGYYVRKQWRAVCYLGLRDGLAPLHTLRIFLYSKIECITHNNSDSYSKSCVPPLMDPKNE